MTILSRTPAAFPLEAPLGYVPSRNRVPMLPQTSKVPPRRTRPEGATMSLNGRSKEVKPGDTSRSAKCRGAFPFLRVFQPGIGSVFGVFDAP